MCGIVGFVNYKQDISNYKNILTDMNNTLSRRGPDEEGYYMQKHVALGHKRLIVIDPDGGKQPMKDLGHRNIPFCNYIQWADLQHKRIKKNSRGKRIYF